MSQEVVLRPHPVEITEAYDVRETLGSGHFSMVMAAQPMLHAHMLPGALSRCADAAIGACCR